MSELGDHASMATATAGAAAAGDVVVVSIPLKSVAAVPVALLAGKVVIDTNNYYPQRDGHIAADEERNSNELLQDYLPQSHVVKAFNAQYAADLTADRPAARHAGRRARPVRRRRPGPRPFRP